MMICYGLQEGRLERIDHSIEMPSPSNVIWIDLFNPSTEDKKAVESMLGLEVPTRQEMTEIEESARLYEEHGALIMTAVVIYGIAQDHPARAQVTFVLSEKHLVLLRYADPAPFRTFEAKCRRQPSRHTSNSRIFVSLLEGIVERAADVLELVSADLNEISTALFIEPDGGKKRKPTREEDEMQALIKRLGRKNMTISILRESLLSLSRIVPYARQGASQWLANGEPTILKQLERDLRSLTAFENQLSSEIGYLHEATLGLINLAQNRIIKVFSVAAVLFLPPTVVGTIYGMNFESIPELKWAFGYPMALCLMILSAVLPYYWFKRRGWL